MRTRSIVITVVTGVLSLGTLAGASTSSHLGESGDDNAAEISALVTATSSLLNAVRQAEAETKGVPFEAGMGSDDRKSVYEISAAAGDVVTEVSIDPGLAAAERRRGAFYHDQIEQRWAIKDLDQALRLNIGNWLAYFGRGLAYSALGEYQRSIADFDETLRLNEHFALAYFARGNSYQSIGNPSRAIKDYDQAVRLDPSNAHAYFNRGNAFALLADYHRVIEDYDQVLRLDPGYAHAYYNRANAQCHLGRVEASYNDRMQALRLGVISAEFVQNALRERGFYKGAIDGDFGPAARNALREWTAARCP